MTLRIAIDVGGTFTDVVTLDDVSGDSVVIKTPTTPEDPSVGFTAGVEQVLAEAGSAGADVSMVLHGTTIATNAIIEARYVPIGLVVTRGFRYILECARQEVPGDFGDITWWVKPPRVVPLEWVREVRGRIDARGEVIEDIDPDEVRQRAAEFRELGLQAVAVSLVNAYKNPEHEERIREIFAEVYPECTLSVGTDVIREYREYERTLSTCLNTGLMPEFSEYVRRLGARLSNVSVEAPLRIMKSSGGVGSASEVIRSPIQAALSGPAAGVMGACVAARKAGHEDVLTIDMGGTSVDVAVIQGGTPQLRSEGRIDIYDIKVPMIDMATLGAGGGSIAWISEGGNLRVGPQSASATPGPVCYHRGGTEPTVSDANIVLGRISEYLLGGSMVLNRRAAYQAIDERLAQPLGISVERAAQGVLQLAIDHTAAGIRLVSVKRGRDPRRYAMVPFGGAGPLHAAMVADALGIATIVVPRSPGATSAEGLLYSDVRVDHVFTGVQREDRLDPARVSEELGSLRERAAEDLDREGIDPGARRYEGFADMRYAGQAYEIRLPLAFAGDDGDVGQTDLVALVEGFHDAHEHQYGYSYRGEELVELVNLGQTGYGVLRRPSWTPPSRAERGGAASAIKYLRPMYQAESDSMVETPIYARDSLSAGDRVEGPAVIEQYDTTIVVETGWVAVEHEAGHLLLQR